MSAGYELDVRGQHALYDYQNQNQGIGCQIGVAGQQSLLGCTPYWSHCACPPNSLDFELTITQVSEAEPLLNYGAKLRLVMADPYKGIELREAIAKLKTALKEAYQQWQQK